MRFMLLTMIYIAALMGCSSATTQKSDAPLALQNLGLNRISYIDRAPDRVHQDNGNVRYEYDCAEDADTIGKYLQSFARTNSLIKEFHVARDGTKVAWMFTVPADSRVEILVVGGGPRRSQTNRSEIILNVQGVDAPK